MTPVKILVLTCIFWLIFVSVGIVIWTLHLTLPDRVNDFFFLADIVKATTKKSQSNTQKLKSLTDWLSIHVQSTENYPGWGKVAEYPEWFNPRSVATVIKGGIGNCGYQANNIITLAQYLGTREAEVKNYYLDKSTGSDNWHSFAEIKVDGKWGVFDPNMLGYMVNDSGQVLSLKEIVQSNIKIPNKRFSKIVEEIRNNPRVLGRASFPIAYLPFGKSSYKLYRSYGKFPLILYFHVKYEPLLFLCIVLALTTFFYIAVRIFIPKNR